MGEERAVRSRRPSGLIAVAGGVVLALLTATTLDGPPAGAQPQGPAHPWPSIWTVEFTLKDVAQGGMLADAVRRTTTWTGMSHGVSGLPDMLVRPETTRGAFRNVIDSRRRDSHADIVTEGSSDPPLLPRHPEREHERQLLVGRRVSIKACRVAKTDGTETALVEGLDVWPKGSQREQGSEDSFVVSNNFIWPKGTEIRTVYTRPLARRSTDLDETTSLITLTEQEVPYDYRLLVNEKTGHPLPSEGIDITGLRQVSRTIDYRITR